MISLEQIQKYFPEARNSNSSGHDEFYVHCRREHKKGGVYKMSINAESGVYYCHDCGATGNVINDYIDGMSAFDMYSVNREDQSNKHVQKRRFDQFWEKEVPLPGDLRSCESLDEDHPVKIYLKRRNINNKEMEKFELMYCSSGLIKFCNGIGTTAGRIIFPIRMGGELVGWQARVVDGSTKSGRRAVWHGESKGWFYPVKSDDGTTWSDHGVPKYYTCPGMPRSKALFNFDNALRQGKDMVVVTEGPIDCMKVGDKSVCTFGSKISDQQIRIIKANWESIIWLLDADIDTESKWFEATKQKCVFRL
jgi:DNA primase